MPPTEPHPDRRPARSDHASPFFDGRTRVPHSLNRPNAGVKNVTSADLQEARDREHAERVGKKYRLREYMGRVDPAPPLFAYPPRAAGGADPPGPPPAEAQRDTAAEWFAPPAEGPGAPPPPPPETPRSGRRPVAPPHATPYNPVTNEDRPGTAAPAEPPGTGAGKRRPGTAHRATDPIGQREETREDYEGRSHVLRVATTGAVHGAEAGRQKRHGDPNGTFNPITGEWTVAPAASSTRAQVPVSDAVARGRRIPPDPPSVGLFNPLTDEWVRPPRDERMVHGLTFTPRTIDRPLDSSLKLI